MPETRTLSVTVARAIRRELPQVAEATVATIVAEVPAYADAYADGMSATIENAVQLALGGFLELATTRGAAAADTPIQPALDASYRLGRGEARGGRSMDALLAAFRVGARVAFRGLADRAVAAGLSAAQLARFAELVFAYIDALTAASVAGHSDERQASGRVRSRLLEKLGLRLLAAAPQDELVAAAERADWVPPRTLTAVLLPAARVRGALPLLDSRTLQPGDDDVSVLLVPDAEGPARGALLRALEGREAVVGPPRPWWDAAASHRRAARVLELDPTAPGAVPVDTQQRLCELVLHADEDALADLRAAALAPLEDLSESAREKLTETLRAWLLHHGRRDAVAAELFVHPQTVRYRMGQLRELYGDRLEDPRTVLELTLALA
ncbi:helix-turn-helix domain-containing protein [Klenkia brasiliensis]|uniref:PucR C-terminal helix-turn-helix domain-containing protein n=1 Tax=Klenkia brasiliensis TaxID=333142 RepID=A0A1G7SNX0_9ACTN|nr:helix-turn-helix domain-containing protein [Klenkia brasiliensis]SDG24668.1 PucR C-terminal helix-turn-helix domain-containing protein [Klenkia brasiliensis]